MFHLVMVKIEGFCVPYFGRQNLEKLAAISEISFASASNGGASTKSINSAI